MTPQDYNTFIADKLFGRKNIGMNFYGNDIAALLVMDKMSAYGWRSKVFTYSDGYYVAFCLGDDKIESVQFQAQQIESRPAAITIAAYRALGGE